MALFLAIFSSGVVQAYVASPVSAVAEDHIVVCHKTGNGYNLVPPSQTSEHLTDPDDFIIESTYSPTQVWDNYKAEYQMLCDAGPTVTAPTAPTFTDLCGTDNDTYTVPTKTGIAYFVNGSATATAAGVYPGSGAVTIVAKALWGQVLTGTTQWSYTFLATPACTITVTPQAPSTTPVCGPTNDLFIIPTQSGVTYSGAVWSNNSATITATAQPGYALTGTTTWTLTDSNVTCPMPVTPVAPTVTPITACGTYGSILMATTPGVTYTLTVGDGTQGAYTVTATAQKNYYFTEGAQTTWSGDLGKYFACLSVEPCEAISGPELVNSDTQFADYQDTRASGHYEFTPTGLHIWTTDATSQAKVAWYHSVDYPLSQVGAPSMDYTSTNGIDPGLQLAVDFDNNGTVDGILVGESVYGNNWWLSNSAQAFVKTGAPHNGGGYGSQWYGTLDEWLTYFPSAHVKAVGFSLGSGVLADGTLHSLTFGCHKWVFGLLPVTPTAATKDDTCYNDNDWYYVPSTDHVIYSVNGKPVSAGWHTTTDASVTVVATVDDGYYLAEGAPSSWTFDYTNEQCVTISKSAEKYVDTNGNGVVDVGDSVSWTITLTNTSGETLDDSILDDHFFVSVLDEGATLDETTIDDLAPGESVTLHASKPLSTSEVQACKATNTASFIAWRQVGEVEQVISLSDDMLASVASGDASATIALTCGQVLGTSTTVTSTVPAPATIADTGAAPHQMPLLVGLVLSAATYYFVLRRQDQRA